MNSEKLQIINKIFNNTEIRSVWNKEDEKYYISIVDVVGIVSESADPVTYWRKLKQRLKTKGNETATNCAS